MLGVGIIIVANFPRTISKQVILESISTSKVVDLDNVKQCIERWMQNYWPGSGVQQIATPRASGASSQILILDMKGVKIDEKVIRKAVLRKTSRYPVYPHSSVQMQSACMGLARDGGCSYVPKVYGVEPSEAVCGGAFILMEYMDGRGAPDFPSYVAEGWMSAMAGEQQRALWNNALNALAGIHKTPISRANIERLRLPFGGDNLLEQLLEYWEAFLALVVRSGEVPELQEAVMWLKHRKPQGEFEPTLVWGDASLRNMLFCGVNVQGCLDFEFSHVGLADFDVLFFILMDYLMAAGFAGGVPRLPGFGNVAESIAAYEMYSGRVVREREYFTMMALTYMALSTTRVFQRLEELGKIDRATVMENPALCYLRMVLATGKFPE